MKREPSFEMWEPFRQSLIDAHHFYFKQAKQRLLSQFNHIEEEAEKVAIDYLEQNNQYFDPDIHDVADFYEKANNLDIEFYTLLSEMRDQTYLSVVAGMYHQWDKQFRQWLVYEANHWCKHNKIKKEIWKVDIGKLFSLMQSFGWDIESRSYFKVIEGCRLVVNVYKHGEGSSLDKLRTDYPKYLKNGFNISSHQNNSSDKRYLNYTDLKVNDEQIQELSDAILAFWNDVPEKLLKQENPNLPDWFNKLL